MKKNLNEVLALLPGYSAGMLGQFEQARELAAKMSEERKAELKQENSDWLEIGKDYVRGVLSLYFNQREAMAVEDGIARIHVKGFLASGLSFIESCTEASDYRAVQKELRQAAEDPTVSGILLRIDSPGGSVVGCLETAQIVASISKPVSAHIQSLGGSAAYFIASGAQAIYSNETAFVGSIGTIATFMDYAGFLENAGITPHIFTSPGADMKASGNQYRTPTEAEKEDMEEVVREYGDQFLSFVLSRREVSPEVLRGNAVSGRQAPGFGLTDGIATEAEVIEELHALVDAAKLP